MTPAVGSFPNRLSVADTVPVVVRLESVAGTTLDSLGVQWQTTDDAVLTIQTTGRDSTEVIARSAGNAEIVGIVDPGGFQPQSFGG